MLNFLENLGLFLLVLIICSAIFGVFFFFAKVATFLAESWVGGIAGHNHLTDAVVLVIAIPLIFLFFTVVALIADWLISRKRS